jgi:hypothetical protein
MTDSTPTGAEPQDYDTVRNEALRLASMSFSIETSARIETLLWVLGHIDGEYCPTGEVDYGRIRKITNRGPWPFDPSLPEVDHVK